ncbi:MAG: SRPBCC family protein [Candidatus Marinimicrobia bacterium]|nr:SRPBCC family protein [Candidatus Neomarinimicrobiota bacterium]
MAFYQFKRVQIIDASLDEVWEFISNPENLKRITPDYMGFDINSEDHPEKMYAGMIISYCVSPLLGISTTWVTEITQVDAKKYFVDEQRIGPYKLWHHQHHLEQMEAGIQMTDIVSYRPPFSLIGALANKFIIKRKLNEIFDHRSKVLKAIF